MQLNWPLQPEAVQMCLWSQPKVRLSTQGVSLSCRCSLHCDSLVLAASPIRCNCASATNELLFNCEPMQHAVQHGVLSLRPILQRARVVQAQSQWSSDGGGAGIGTPV